MYSDQSCSRITFGILPKYYFKSQDCDYMFNLIIKETSVSKIWLQIVKWSSGLLFWPHYYNSTTIQIHGSNEIVKSDFIQIKPSVTPDPPQITVTVIGLEDRRQIEKVTCDLINSRDRLEWCSSLLLQVNRFTFV